MSEYISNIRNELKPYFCDDVIGIIIGYITVKCNKHKSFKYDCMNCYRLWLDCWKMDQEMKWKVDEKKKK